MNSSVCLRRVVSLISLLGCVLVAGDCLAQEELLTEKPERLRAYGVVRDEDGKSLPNAEVTLFAIGSLYQSGKTAFRSTKSNDNGEFSLDFAPDDPFVSTLFRYNFQMLMVQASGHATQIVRVSLERLMTDLPFDFKAPRCAVLDLQVLDAEGRPVADAKVQPAGLATVPFLPLATPWLETFQTDPTGRVTLRGFASLKSVYIQSRVHGNQIVPVSVSTVTQTLTAQIGRTGRVHGRLTLPDGADAKQLKETKLMVMTLGNAGTKGITKSWAMVELDDGGRFFVDQLCMGQISVSLDHGVEFDYVLPYQSFPPLQWDAEGKAELGLEVKINPVQKQEFKFVDEDGNPVPGILVYVPGTRLDGQVTTTDGIYVHRWSQGESLEGQIFLDDGSQVYHYPGSVGVILDSLKATDGVPIELRMTRSRSLRGIVVDDKGAPVAGAMLARGAVSDKLGKFEIRGLAPSELVEMRASKGYLATNAQQVFSVQAGHPNLLTLVVSPQPVAQPTGRVLDPLGQPVAGARVYLQKISVYEQEDVNSSRYSRDVIEACQDGTVTNHEGLFQFPPILEFSERLTLKIERPGFVTRETPPLDGSSRPIEDQRFHMGDVTLVPEPAKMTTQIAVVDAMTGSSIPAAEVVCLGILSGRSLGITNDEGKLEIDLKNTPQVIAVRSPHHQIHIQFLDQMVDPITVPLLEKTQLSDRPPHPWFQRDPEAYLAASRRLMDQLPVPAREESSFYRQSLYFSALAGVDVERAEKLLGKVIERYKYRSTFFRQHIGWIIKHDANRVIERCRHNLLPPDFKFTTLVSVAQASTDEEAKDDLFGEVSLLLREYSGGERLWRTGSLAKVLLLHGRVEAAEAILEDAWVSAVDLRLALAANQRQLMVGESRGFLPSFAMINLPDAIKLIRLTALESEKAYYLSEAVLLHCLARQCALGPVLQEHDISFFTSENAVVYSELISNPLFAKWLADNLEAIPASRVKLQLILQAARHLPPWKERDRLLRVAAEVRALGCRSGIIDDTNRLVLREIEKIRSLRVGELDALVFECLKDAPDSFASDRKLGAFGTLAALLAFHDPVVARQFLQSAVEAERWCDVSDYEPPFRNTIIRAAAWIDPDYACEVAETLGQRWDREGGTNKLELYSDMIQTLNGVRILID